MKSLNEYELAVVCVFHIWNTVSVSYTSRGGRGLTRQTPELYYL